MVRRSKAPRSKITRLRAQTKAIRCVNGFVLCLFGLAVGALAIASALPQRQMLAEKREELRRIEAREGEVIAEKEDIRASLKALQEDPEYLEQHARDRLNLYAPGERIYRMERTP